MRRTTTGLVCALAVLAAMLGSPVTAVARAPVGPTSPNILLVNLDDARHDALQHMPKTRGWLYPTGRRYLAHRVAIPSCCPSRSSLFTGRYPHNNGVRVQSQGPALDRDHTLMSYLSDAGYRTAMAGKFLVSWPGPTGPPAFDRHTVIEEGYYGYDAWVDGVLQRPAAYSTTYLGAQLRSFLRGFESVDSTPWFGYFAPQAPHVETGWKTLATPEAEYADTTVAPCVRPAEADRTDKPAYLGWAPYDRAYVERMCSSQIRTLWSVDDEVDRLLTQLRDTGELAQTLVIVTSDNGYHWGEQGWMTKFTPYDPSLRVPLVVRWDGHVAAGTTSRRLTSHVDVLPTVLGVLGRAPSVPLDGRSLFAASTARSRLLSEYFLDTGTNGPMPTFAALTTPTRKYVESTIRSSDGTTRVFKELYRLDADPGELVNVLRDGTTANDPPTTVLQTWTRQLAAARSCAGSTCP